jgi:hypothetical protein
MAAWLLSVVDTAVVATILLAALGWLLRNWIAARLTSGIQLETEKKLEEFKRRLDAAEAEVSAVRQAGLDAVEAMRSATHVERVQAIKEIWLGVVDWKAATAVSTIISAVDLEIAAKSAGHPGTTQTFKSMLESIKHIDLAQRVNALARWRPFVTPRTWALFAAYHGFYAARVGKAALLIVGHVEMIKRVWRLDSELQIVRASAPPEIVAAYEREPVAAGPKFLTYIEDELLAELQRSLAGEHSGPEASRQAAKIIAAVDGVLAEAQKAKLS